MSTSSSHSADSLVEGMTIGDHFIVRGKLGGGGMGEVFLAENLNVPDRKYAIKVLRREFSENARFVALLQDEATKQSRLDHDNIVGMYDFFRWAGHYCLVQNFVKGKTVGQMIADQPAGLDCDTALTLMLGILSGLDHAHELGILHCDVKPANVIVDLDGRPRVTDFGISRDVGPKAHASGLGGAGTLEYMSPEQIRPPYDIDHRTDVFSAGVMFFEMLCGRLPFTTDPRAGSMVPPQTVMDAPDVRRFRVDVPEPVARIVATALQRDPAQRFQGCADFAQAIVDYRKDKRWREKTLPVIIGVSVLVVAVAIGLYVWREHVREQVLLQARETVHDTLTNAAVSMNLLCRESAEYTRKHVGLEQARAIHLDDVAKKFEVRLADLQDNISRQATAYAGAVRALNAIDPALVAEGITAQAAADPQLQSVANAFKADDAALRAGGSIVSRDELLRRCPPLENVPTQ